MDIIYSDPMFLTYILGVFLTFFIFRKDAEHCIDCALIVFITSFLWFFFAPIILLIAVPEKIVLALYKFIGIDVSKLPVNTDNRPMCKVESVCSKY